MLDWARRIVGDSRALRQEINALTHGLSGRLRIAVMPTALAMIETLTTLYRNSSAASEPRSVQLDNLRLLEFFKMIDASTTSRSAASPACRSTASVIS